jgi:hypothetical protein
VGRRRRAGAGLALTHYRVAIFYALWWAAALALNIFHGRGAIYRAPTIIF